MSCNFVINQQSSLPAPEAKVKDPARQKRGKKLHKTYMKKLTERFLKDNQEAQMTLKEFIDYFQQGLITAIEETMCIMKELNMIDMSSGGTDHAENVCQRHKEKKAGKKDGSDL